MKVVAKNRKATYDYDIIDTVEAGIMLTGQEVKSCREGHMNLAGSYVSFLGGSPMLKNSSISAYRFAHNIDAHEPSRDRQLLLHKKEISKIESQLQEKGVSLIPIEVRAGRHIKLILGLGKGQKRIDKRQKIKQRDMDRKAQKGEEY